MGEDEQRALVVFLIGAAKATLMMGRGVGMRPSRARAAARGAADVGGGADEGEEEQRALAVLFIGAAESDADHVARRGDEAEPGAAKATLMMGRGVGMRPSRARSAASAAWDEAEPGAVGGERGIKRLSRGKRSSRVLPGHAKVVKALMRVLVGREQDRLRKLCEKPREEDIMKYIQEMAYED